MGMGYLCRVNLFVATMLLEMGPFMNTIGLAIKLKNNFTVLARMNGEQALWGKTYKTSQQRRHSLPVEGHRLELASLARHAVDVCLSEGSLFPIPLPFYSIITTLWPC